MIKNLNKASKARRGASLDIWESKHLVGGYVMKREAKKASKRADRRSKKALIKEQIS